MSPLRPIGVALAELLAELDASEAGGTVDLTVARIRRHVRRDELWRAGAEGEQLVLDLGGTAVMT